MSSLTKQLIVSLATNQSEIKNNIDIDEFYKFSIKSVCWRQIQTRC